MSSEDPQRFRRRMIGIGFVLAFALSTATIIYTGLNVRAPGSASESSSVPPGSTSQREPAMPDDAEPAGDPPADDDASGESAADALPAAAQ